MQDVATVGGQRLLAISTDRGLLILDATPLRPLQRFPGL
jgi:hypothetical protein